MSSRPISTLAFTALLAGAGCGDFDNPASGGDAGPADAGIGRSTSCAPDRPRTPGAGAAVHQRVVEANTVDPALFGEYSCGEPGSCDRLGL